MSPTGTNRKNKETNDKGLTNTQSPCKVLKFKKKWVKVIVRRERGQKPMKTKKANRFYSDIENDRVQRHRRIASTMFNEDVINMGRVLVLFAFTSQMGKQYPTDAWRFWDIYHTVLKGTEYEYFNRSLINQSE